MRRDCVASATVLLCLSAFATVALCLDNGVGMTPAMGWSSWNKFRCDINDTVIRSVADAMVYSGLRDAGYKYVNIDDCWMEKRDANGRIVPFLDKFPNMKALGDYIHSLGLKFGMYTAAGNKTCEGYPASWGHEEIDAQTYAEWGVDFVKYDFCDMQDTKVSVRKSYEQMRDAILKTGRPMVYSLCSWGSGAPWEWGKEVGNSWRTGIDVAGVWDDESAKRLKLPSFMEPIMRAVENQAQYADKAGPGGFNDPDMLWVGLDGLYPYGIVQECPEHVIGCKPGEYISRERWGKVGGLTFNEQRTHFSFWVMLSSPLILGNDPRDMDKATKSILLAKEIISISQDELALQARRTWKSETGQVWVKPLTGGRVAVMLFNPSNHANDVLLNFTRDLPEYSAKWARDVPDTTPDCVDKKPEQCKSWAASGECKSNPGFMFSTCPRSCPAGCPHSIDPPGPKATALLRDAWAEEDLGAATYKWTAKLMDPHACRVLVLTFVEPAQAEQEKVRIAEDKKKGSGAGGGAVVGAGAGGAVVANSFSSEGSGTADLLEAVGSLKRELQSMKTSSTGVNAGAGASLNIRKLDESIRQLASIVLESKSVVDKVRKDSERADQSIQSLLTSANAGLETNGGVGRVDFSHSVANGVAASAIFDSWQGRTLLLCSLWSAVLAFLMFIRGGGMGRSSRAAAGAHVHRL